MTSNGTFGRREFLKAATQVAATAAVCHVPSSSTAGAETPGRSSGTLPTRTLGKTGLKLPILGYGGAALPKNWANPLSHEDRVALVRYAWDQGVRYFDTSPVYMESEAILGEALRDRRRDVCLVTKVESTRPEDVRKSVEQSLQTLRTDYLDILLIHGTPGLEQMSVPQAMKVHAELVKLREESCNAFSGDLPVHPGGMPERTSLGQVGTAPGAVPLARLRRAETVLGPRPVVSLLATTGNL